MKRCVNELVNMRLYQEASILLGMPVNNLPFLTFSRMLEGDLVEITYDSLHEMYQDPDNLPDEDLRALALAGVNSGKYVLDFEGFLLGLLCTRFDAVFELYCFNCTEDSQTKETLRKIFRGQLRPNLFECAVVLYGLYECNIAGTANERKFFMKMLINRIGELVLEDASVVMSNIQELVYAADVTEEFCAELNTGMAALFLFTKVLKGEKSRPAKILEAYGLPYETAILFLLYCLSVREDTDTLHDVKKKYFYVKLSSPFVWSDESKEMLQSFFHDNYRSLNSVCTVNRTNYQWLYEKFGFDAADFLCINLGDKVMYQYLQSLDDMTFLKAFCNSISLYSKDGELDNTVVTLISENLTDKLCYLFGNRCSVGGFADLQRLYLTLRESGVVIPVGSNGLWQTIIEDSEYTSQSDWILADCASGVLSTWDVNRVMYQIMQSRRIQDFSNSDAVLALLKGTDNVGLAHNFAVECYLPWLADNSGISFEDESDDCMLALTSVLTEELSQVISELAEKVKPAVELGLSPFLYGLEDLKARAGDFGDSLAEMAPVQRLTQIRYGATMSSRAWVPTLEKVVSIWGFPKSDGFAAAADYVTSNASYWNKAAASLFYCLLRDGMEHVDDYNYFFCEMGGTIEDLDIFREKITGGWLTYASFKSVNELYALEDVDTFKLTFGLDHKLKNAERKVLQDAFTAMSKEQYLQMLACWEWSNFELKIGSLVSVWPKVTDSNNANLAAWLLCNKYTELGEGVSECCPLLRSVLSDYQFVSKCMNWKDVTVNDLRGVRASKYNDAAAYDKNSIELLGSECMMQVTELLQSYPALTDVFNGESLRRITPCEIQAAMYNLSRHPVQWYLDTFKDPSSVLRKKFDWDTEAVEFEDWLCENTIFALDLKTQFVLSIAESSEFQTIKRLLKEHPDKIMEHWKDAWRFVQKERHSVLDDISEMIYDRFAFYEIVGRMDEAILKNSSPNCQSEIFCEWNSFWNKSCTQVEKTYYMIKPGHFSWFDIYVGGKPNEQIYLFPVDGVLSIVGDSLVSVESEDVLSFAKQYSLPVYYLDSLGTKRTVHVFSSVVGTHTVFNKEMLFEDDVFLKLENLI